MKLFLRVAALILAMLFVLLPVSCAKSDTPDTPDASDETTAATDSKASQYEEIYREREDKLPELDFGGEKINILCLGTDIYEKEVATDELNSESLNDAIYTRNLDVGERLNVEIAADERELYDGRDRILKAINSGDDTYQVYASEAAPLLQNAMDGYFYNLCDLEKGYMEFEAPWYSQDYLDSICTGEQIYCITGSMSLSMLRSVHVIYFNKKLAVDYNIPDLYEVVNSGKWTIDYETELTGNLYRDLNGNSEADNEDFYGFRTNVYWGTDCYWVAFDINFLSKDSEGDFFFDLDTEKLTNSILKIYNLVWDSTGSYQGDHSDTENIESFASGRTFMVMANIGFAEGDVLRNMTDEYGIIPVPKYDEEQKGYYSNPNEIFQMYGIPVTAKDPDMVSAVLEAMFAESWRKVIPIYSDIALKGKYMNDLESRKMFDMIIENMRFEPSLLYTYALQEIPTDLMRYPISEKTVDINSRLAKYNRVINISLRELNEALD